MYCEASTVTQSSCPINEYPTHSPVRMAELLSSYKLYAETKIFKRRSLPCLRLLIHSMAAYLPKCKVPNVQQLSLISGVTHLSEVGCTFRKPTNSREFPSLLSQDAHNPWQNHISVERERQGQVQKCVIVYQDRSVLHFLESKNFLRSFLSHFIFSYFPTYNHVHF